MTKWLVSSAPCRPSDHLTAVLRNDPPGLSLGGFFVSVSLSRSHWASDISGLLMDCGGARIRLRVLAGRSLTSQVSRVAAGSQPARLPSHRLAFLSRSDLLPGRAIERDKGHVRVSGRGLHFLESVFRFELPALQPGVRVTNAGWRCRSRGFRGLRRRRGERRWRGSCGVRGGSSVCSRGHRFRGRCRRGERRVRGARRVHR